MTDAPENLPTLHAISATPKPLIGFIGQGFIGKNYAYDFERRGYECVRYSLEPEFVSNKNKIKDCDIVFIAVPTPTTPEGFSSRIVEEALMLVGIGKIAVIKSTILPGTTARLQRVFPGATILYSPEFLSEKTAAQDAAHPFSNIVGIPVDDDRHRAAAQLVLSILPQAPHAQLCTSNEAELIKYSHNLNGYWQIMLSNILYDAAQSLDARWSEVELALKHDPMISNRYIKPVHQSGHPGAKPGRGAGGHCFIKDFAAFRELYVRLQPNDARGLALLSAIEQKNIELLREGGKDLDLVKEVYGSTEPGLAPLEVPVIARPRLVPSFGRFDAVVMGVGALVIIIGIVDLVSKVADILK
jgi:UDP-glucose 6-dehydrogenase